MLKGTQQQSQFKILVVGDACIDIYYFGTCDRLSPEAPVPVFERKNTITKPGMCLNVSSNLASIGCEVRIERNLEKIKKIRMIDQRSGQHILRVDEEPKITSVDLRLFTKKILSNFDAMIISDYNKGFIKKGDILDIIEPARRLGIPIFVDSKKTDLSSFEECFIKINNKEYQNITKLPNNCELIVTQGSKGCTWRNHTFPTKSVEVHDVCGAGDVFLSSLVVRWLETKDMKKSIKTANACASLSVTKFGTYILTRKEYEDLRI